MVTPHARLLAPEPRCTPAASAAAAGGKSSDSLPNVRPLCWRESGPGNSAAAQHDRRGVVTADDGAGEQVVLPRLVAQRVQRNVALRVTGKGQRAAGLEQGL